ncbi:MAG: hypothetical protein N2V78_02625 [Methanophagales archaeon]|nr:hypothetical protein [Methanophagales archaeon]
MLYNVWQFFKWRVPFRRFVNILFRMSIIEALVIEMLKEEGIFCFFLSLNSISMPASINFRAEYA